MVLPSYCTPDQARAAGATGTDAEVTAVIERASRRVDAFTDELWAPATVTVAANVGAGRVVLLPRKVRADQTYTVRVPGQTSDLAATGYRVDSSDTIGQTDSLVLGGQYLSDPLVLGAEPWNGGWGSLFERQGIQPGQQMLVTGSFGHAVTPPDVAAATALLAALLQGSISEGDDQPSTGLDVDAEGRSLVVTSAGPTPVATVEQTSRRSTGYPAVDSMLFPLVRRPVRFS